MKKLLVISAIIVGSVIQPYAKENIGSSGKTAPYLKKAAAGCEPATAQTDLNINNVRTTLLNGGDKWWNLNDARYEVPKIDPPGSAPSVHSLFAGAVWLGGIDAGGQLKIAAQTYRQSGNDFWPGPLDASANVTQQTCQDYDRHWKVLGSEIDQVIAIYEQNGTVGESQIPNSIKEWPAKGNPFARGARGVSLNITQDLAPFYDRDGDGLYNPVNGDYPIIRKKCEDVYADEMIFWVYNDKGNNHSETGGLAIGVQVNAMAFAFATSDEINNMTFYTYEIIDKSTVPISDFYMGQWVDADLGCYNNDYVGCDVNRSLGICYNGTISDPDCASRGYGINPPIIGVDYFEGPLDENGQQLGMSTFTYYNNDFTPTGNPVTAIQFYNYMRGFWKDGLPFSDDGTQASCNYRQGTPVKYMYPGDPTSGSVAAGQKSECSCNNLPADRRFVQASGPFTLIPGAVNSITIGVVWNRPQNGSACGSGVPFDLSIGQVDDKAQALFDNCFKLVDGPDAPTLVIRELDKEIIIALVNEPGSNNINESYDQVDPIARSLALTDPTIKDTTYTFQGYILYQLKNAQVTANELDDVSKARVIAQVDVKDNVTKIVNYTFDPNIGADVPKLMVDGANKGIKTTFRITEDNFSTLGVNTLVNHYTYYFAAVAYAYNNYKPYNPANPTAGGQKQPYLRGRKNFKVYAAIPHKTEPAQGGTRLNSKYGDGLIVTRIEGKGNGGFELDLTDEAIEQIVNSPVGFYGPITYKERMGPIDVKIVDPILVKNAKFELIMFERPGGDALANWQLDDSTSWVLTANGDVIYQGNNIITDKEHYIPDYGISISFGQTINAGDGVELLRQNGKIGEKPKLEKFGYITSSIKFEDEEKQWLVGIADQGQFGPLNWIRSGQYKDNPAAGADGIFDDHYFSGTDTFYDPNEHYEQVLGGVFAPYCLSANYQRKGLGPPYNNFPYSEGPGFPIRFSNQNTTYRIPHYTLDSLHSIDLVITPDKSKWTRCVVVETSEDPSQTEGGAYKGQLRQGTSLDKNGNPIVGEVGMSYFPGYAINVETGERLNMMFGESSWLVGENGRDMIWNPSSFITSPNPFSSQYYLGGKHYIYIMNTRYDEGESMRQTMTDYFNKFLCIPSNPPQVVDASACSQPNRTKQIPAPMDTLYRRIMWVGAFALAPGYQFKSMADGLVPGEVKIKIRVSRAYARFTVDGSNNGFNKYAFTTEGLEPQTEQREIAVKALDQIRVVPNPYYAYSGYEISQLDTRVRITNLPASCVVSIYTLDGVLIRRYNRAVSPDTSPGAPTDRVNLDNSLVWDLKNEKGIPVSSGLYLIHIKADGLGERTIKWFGALRPTDLDTF